MYKKILFLILSSAILYGCSADWHLRRAVYKKPSILSEGKVIREVRDTISVITEKVTHDTIVDFTTDTVIVEKGNAKATVAVDTVMKTIYVEVECDSDTIYVETIKEQTILQPVVKDKRKGWINYAIAAISVLIIILMLMVKNSSPK